MAGARGETPDSGDESLVSRRSVADPVNAALAAFGREVGRKQGRGGWPEDQLRGPLERLVERLSRYIRLPDTVAYGEVSLKELHTRPDYAVDVGNIQVGFIELKSPGHGVPLTPDWRPSADERKQWNKLKWLWNVVYTDGLTWRRYSYGEPVSEPVRLSGGFSPQDKPLQAPDHQFISLITDFLLAPPQAPRPLGDVIRIVAGICDLLQDEVYAVLGGSPNHAAHRHLTLLAENWRDLLFPRLDTKNFADAFAQTVAFALLLARVDGINTDDVPLHEIGRLLGKKHLLIGRAFSVLTDGAAAEELRTIQTLRRVIAAVTVTDISDDDETDVYAELYERFLAVYDPGLRTLSGSFYTPPKLARFMADFAHEILRSELNRPRGLADDVIVIDPAMGTGTFLLEVIRRVAATIEQTLGIGAREDYLKDLITHRLVGFEIQVAPYAVAELRLHQAFKNHFGIEVPPGELRFLTDALANPREQQARLGAPFHDIEENREAANQIKREWPVMLVIGNPPHVKDSKGRAPWVEEPRRHPLIPGQAVTRPSLDEFRADGRYESDLHGMEWYFWRWACWKVFEAHPADATGIVAFVTPSSFLTGQAFAGMREYLRRQCDAGWIINLSPEGNRPPAQTRIFGSEVGRQISIAVFVRRGAPHLNTAAEVYYMSLRGSRAEKLSHLMSVHPRGPDWKRCYEHLRAPFYPASEQNWDNYPSLADLMPVRSRGVTAGRSWVYAPTPETLRRRWAEFIAADTQTRRDMFHETKRYNIRRVPPRLPGFPRPSISLAEESGVCPAPIQVAYRAFDRQWLIPDRRLLAEARTGLWRVRDKSQIFVSEQDGQRIETGPGLVFTALIPDIDHFSGWGGSGVHPLWCDPARRQANFAPGLVEYIRQRIGIEFSPQDLLAYIAAVVAHNGFTQRFRRELEVPGIHVPFTTDLTLWQRAVSLGRELIWLHTYGAQYADASADRPEGERAIVERYGVRCIQAVRALPERLPDQLTYDEDSSTLYVGDGAFRPVSSRVVQYDVAGRRIVWRWLNARTRKPRYKQVTYPQLDYLPIPDWDRPLTDELLALLSVLEGCISLEGSQQKLLDEICDTSVISATDLRQAGVRLGVASRTQQSGPGESAGVLFGSD